MEILRPSAAGYKPALTGLRAYAFCLVLVDHWLGGVFSSLLFGGAGVSFFFVLSGFLISRILLASRHKGVSGSSGSLASGLNAESPPDLKDYLLRFYYRRSLRIVPVYFLTLFVLLLVGDPFVRLHGGLFFGYAVNYLFATDPLAYPIHLGHLWSLSAEEQLYLMLPLLIWFWPSRRIPLLAFLLVAIGIAFRAGCFGLGTAYPWETGYTSALGCLDSYGLGLMLAYYYSDQWSGHTAPAKELARRNFFRSGLLWFMLSLSWPLVIFTAQLWYATGQGVYANGGLAVLSRLSVSLLGAYLIGYLLEGPARSSSWWRNGTIGRLLLENRVVLYIGKISYGLYLFHNLIYHHFTPADYPVRRLFSHLVTYLPFSVIPSSGSHMALAFYGCLCLGLASVSWFLLEKPFLSLRPPSGGIHKTTPTIVYN